MSAPAARAVAPPAPIPGTSFVFAPASSRSSWSGLLRLSLVAVPVKGYTATVSAPESHFHQLHAGCGQRVRYDKQCPLHGSLDASAITKGYEYASGQHLVLDEEQLDKLRPAKDRALTLEHFVDPEQMDPSLLVGRHLYLVPDGPAARTPYAVLAQAMRQSRKWAVGRVALSGQRRPALVRPNGRVLLLHVLHFPAHVRAGPSLDLEGAGAAGNEAEHALAGQLIDHFSRPVVWSDYRDDSAEQLAALVEATLAGRSIGETAAEEVTIIRLLDALQQSVAAVTPSSSQPDTPPAQRRKRSPSRRSA